MTMPDRIIPSVEAFEQFAEKDSDRLFELIDGEVYEKMPTQEHGKVQLRFGSRLLLFVDEHGIAAHVGVEVRHRLPTDRKNSRIPDVSVQLTTDPAVTKGSVLRMPDLAVEIFSPDDEYKDLHAKAEYYLKHGSRLVWLAFPATRTVEVCTLDADGKMDIEALGIEDILDGGDVLPGFTLAIKDVFAGL